MFISYAQADEAHCKVLESHLASLERDKLISIWHAGRLAPGDEKARISAKLDSASVILLLVSADFVSSGPTWDHVESALKRQRRGEARVIPIIVRPCEWDKEKSLATLTPLPRNRLPVTSWPNRDEAWADIAEGIRVAVEEQRATTYPADVDRVDAAEEGASRDPRRADTEQPGVSSSRKAYAHKSPSGRANLKVMASFALAGASAEVAIKLSGGSMVAAFVAFVAMVVFAIGWIARSIISPTNALGAEPALTGVSSKASLSASAKSFLAVTLGVSGSSANVLGTVVTMAASGAAAIGGAEIVARAISEPGPISGMLGSPPEVPAPPELESIDVAPGGAEVANSDMQSAAEQDSGPGPDVPLGASVQRHRSIDPGKAKIKMGATSVSGRVPPQAVRLVVEQNRAMFNACYATLIPKSPGAKAADDSTHPRGRVVTRLVIGRDGVVSNVENVGSDLLDPGFVTCILGSFRRLSFPPPAGGILTVNYPIDFPEGVGPPLIVAPDAAQKARLPLDPPDNSSLK